MIDWVALSEIVRNAALALAALVGSFLAWRQLSPAASQARSANTQATLARRAHVTDLFERAIGQLRHPNLEVRLGAVYVLREIARDFPDLANPVFDLLQAYLRESGMDYGEQDPPIDVREIVATLKGRIGDTHDRQS